MKLFANDAVGGVGTGRKTMKRLSVLVIAAALLFSGCGYSEPENGSGSIPPSGDPVFSSSTSGVSVPNSSSTLESLGGVSSAVDSSSAVEPPQSSGTASEDGEIPEKPTEKEENDLEIKITINGRAFSATLYDNETARAFKARLPLSLDMSELNGNEKYCYLPDDLPTDPVRPSRINAGDIMLYGSSCIVIFYESFSTSYSYTPIGKIDDPEGLAAALGSGGVRVSF